MSSTTFTTSYTVTIADINYGKHMGNDRFLSVAHEARLRFLASMNQSELDFYGTQLILSEAQLSFKKQVFHGDVMYIDIDVTHRRKIGFTLHYTFYNHSREHVIALIDTKMVCFNYSTQKVTGLPDSF